MIFDRPYRKVCLSMSECPPSNQKRDFHLQNCSLYRGSHLEISTFDARLEILDGYYCQSADIERSDKNLSDHTLHIG